MKNGHARWTVAGLAAMPVGAAVTLVLAPPLVAFGAAVVSAAVWCKWLEQQA